MSRVKFAIRLMGPGTDVIGIAILLLDWFGTCTPKKGDKTKAIYKFDDIHNLNIDYLDEGNHHQFNKKTCPVWDRSQIRLIYS